MSRTYQSPREYVGGCCRTFCSYVNPCIAFRACCGTCSQCCQCSEICDRDCCPDWCPRAADLKDPTQITGLDHFDDDDKRAGGLKERGRWAKFLSSFFAFLMGLVLISIYGYLVIFYENYNIYFCIYSTIAMGFFLCIGMAFSINIRVTVFLMMSHLFSGYARTIILLIILSMAMNGPAANVLENVQRVTNSSACGVQVVMNQTIEIVERVREPLRRSAARPVLKFSPNYSTIFKGEKIKMTCDSQPKEMEYAWFFNNEKIGGNKGNIYEIPSANVMQSGNYHCQTPDGSKSEMVTLNVTEGQLILQTALYIHEGDRLILKCHHNPGITGSQSKFYKNKAELINLNNDPLFMVSDITMNASGLYSCIKELSWGSWSSQSTVYATIKVKGKV